MTAPTVLKLKKSSVSKNIPSASDLEYGELALNYADGVIYYKNSSNAIKSFRDTTSNDSAMSIGDTFTLTSTLPGDSDKPSLILYRNSPSPAVNDDLGEILFRGRNDNTQDVEYGKIWGEIKDETDGAEDGSLWFTVMANGTLSNRMELKGNGKTFFYNKDVHLNAGVNLTFEGATANANDTTITVVDPTGNNTITLPDKDGTVAMTSDISGEAVVMAIALG